MGKNREIQVFGLSFMDLISCGLGGMLVLMFVFSTLVNAAGVSTPSEAQKGGLTVAELQRQQIFNTHFVLKVQAPTGISINYPGEFASIISTGRQTVNNSPIENHIFFVNGKDKVVRQLQFDLTGNLQNIIIQIVGDKSYKLPPGTQNFTVIKDKNQYRFKNESKFEAL